jgi:hypothetical protein
MFIELTSLIKIKVMFSVPSYDLTKICFNQIITCINGFLVIFSHMIYINNI